MAITLASNNPKYNDPILGAAVTGGSWDFGLSFWPKSPTDDLSMLDGEPEPRRSIGPWPTRGPGLHCSGEPN